MINIYLKKIGVVHSPYQEREDAPHQGRTKDELFEIEIFSEFEYGLKDIETASHLIVLSWYHKADRGLLQVNTPWDDKPHGVFATRSPSRPNPIAFSVVELIKRKENVLVVKGLDALDGTPVLDIKPYSSKNDSVENAKLGWLDNAAFKDKRE